ncbi:DUF1904 family protein [Fusobacterium perfoetens]|uniref:DUF1904 family protein n=1 Tax=Fusobacterium perfoetens TaxID=852 RepID=UPI0004870387|nr:DUF1904 family protein [Fusobacterium perfoetens]MCI6153324.1 DUF1904 domain-containing protein [Fusobacterium perfoetens]MDY3237169.1 DUF1904 family protein [Fusobacterium perfoetens]
MPFVKISGISKEKVIEISEDLKNIIVKETETPKERIRIFYDNVVEIFNQKEINNRIIIDIQWLPRPKEMREKVSQAYFSYFENLGYKNIKIYFEDINREYYFVKN